MNVLKELLRRLRLGAKIVVRVALLCPLVAMMIMVSYQVDRSGLFQGELSVRTIVDLLLDGQDVTNFESMNERGVVKLYAQRVEEAPTVAAIGSSRVLQFTRELVGVDSFFNLGVTGADVRDCMTSYYSLVENEKAPEVLIWSVDPYVFYGSEDAFDGRADSELYNEFLQNVLGVDTGYEEPDPVELWTALIDPAYFQGNVDYYFKNRGQTVVTDDDGETIDFTPVQGDPYDQTAAIKRSDGSVLYDKDFRNQPREQVLATAMTQCDTFSSLHMEGFTELSDVQTQAFDAFIRYAQSQGTTVILVLSPWHPYLYDYLLWQNAEHTGFFEVESWVRAYAAANDVPLYGSYDPLAIEGVTELDFFDGLHCKDTAIEKFFPGVPAVLQAVESGTLPDPLATHHRTTEEERVAWE